MFQSWAALMYGSLFLDFQKGNLDPWPSGLAELPRLYGDDEEAGLLILRVEGVNLSQL